MTQQMKWYEDSEWKKRYNEGGISFETGVRKLLTPEIEQVKDENGEEQRSLKFTISSNSIDRMGDKIKQTGWELDNYRKNPVVLWAHNSAAPPVAKASDISVKGNKKLTAQADFVPAEISPFADMIYQMYREKYLNATSVGMIPLEFEVAKDREDEYMLPFDINKQELLEFSAVPVPANPDALVQARKSGIDTVPLREWAAKTMDEWRDNDTHMPFNFSHVEQAYKSTTTYTSIPVPPHEEEKNALKAESESREDEVAPQPASAISYDRAHPEGTRVAHDDADWSGAAVREQLPRDSATRLSIFAWHDAADEEHELPRELSAWKLPHHYADGDQAVSWKGVVAAMAALAGAGGGLILPSAHRREVYNHLARHYREDFNTPPPDYKRVEEEVLASGDHVMDVKTGQIERDECDDALGDDVVTPVKADTTEEKAEPPQQFDECGAESETSPERESEGEPTSSDKGGYQLSLKVGGVSIDCTVNSFAEMVELIDTYGAKQQDSEKGDDHTSSEGKASEGNAGREESGETGKDAAEQAVEDIDFDQLIDKYGEAEVMAMLPEIADEVVDSALDQATGRVH
jgi:HK97 family phage prohead protease